MSKPRVQSLYERRAAVFNEKALAYGVWGRVTAEELFVKPLECHYCHIGLQHTGCDFDHMVPLARGGTNTIDNIVRCCGECNGRKFTKTAEEHLEFVGTEFTCVVCDQQYRPRYADMKRNLGKVCSRRCAGKKRWMNELDPHAARTGRRSGDIPDPDAALLPVRAHR